MLNYQRVNETFFWIGAQEMDKVGGSRFFPGALRSTLHRLFAFWLMGIRQAVPWV